MGVGRPAPLDVAEHDRPRVQAGHVLDPVGQRLAHPDLGEQAVAELVGRDLSVVGLQLDALADHDDGVAPARAGPGCARRPPRRRRALGDEDLVGPAGEPRVERDPAGVAAHDLDDDDPVVRLGRGLQPVDGVHGDLHRGREAEGVVGGREVVVDRLGHADHRQPLLAVQAAGHAEGVLTADGDQRVEAQGVERLGAPPPPSSLERVGARACQHGAAAGEDRADPVGVQRPRLALEQAAPAPQQAHVLRAGAPRPRAPRPG